MDCNMELVRIKTEKFDINIDEPQKIQKQFQLQKSHANYIRHFDLFNSRHTCSICSTKLRTNADSLIHHQILHKNTFDSQSTNKYPCIYCTKKFSLYSKLKFHLMVKHLNESVYKCRICLKQFKNFLNLKLHLKLKHNCDRDLHKLCCSDGKRNYNCVYITDTKLSVCLNPKLSYLNKCRICPASDAGGDYFHTECSYFMHMLKAHTNLKTQTIICSLCNGETFSSLNDFETHIRQQHTFELDEQTVTGQLYSCLFCTKLCQCAASLRLHLKESHSILNSGNFDVKCFVCKMKFRNDVDFKKHFIGDHFFNECKYKCNICLNIYDKAVEFKSKLVYYLHLNLQHQRQLVKHEGSQRVSTMPQQQQVSQQLSVKIDCRLCGLSFTNHITLNQHYLLHISDNLKRPFKCHLCQLTFSKSEQLLRHMIVHDTNKNLDFLCNICYSTFSRKQDLDRHMNFHEKNNI